jgi:hypothetical protein
MNFGQLETEVKSGVTDFLDIISRSPIMIGFAVLVINLGGRFLAGDINRYDEKVLNNKIMKKLTIFAIAFLSTRDIRYSVIIVFLYSILFNPCGLAYKIMKKSQAVMNPFRIFQNLSNDDITTIEIKPKVKSDKIKIIKIKIN